MNITIRQSTLSGTSKAPSSKSYAQRAIAIASLVEGKSVLNNLGQLSHDTRAMVEAVAQMGASTAIEADRCVIIGESDRRADGSSIEISASESGLAARLLLPMAGLRVGQTTLTANGTLMERPMGAITETLRTLGAEIIAQPNPGHLPLTLRGPIVGGGRLEIDGSLSSQYISGLLIVLPLLSQDTELIVRNLRSRPYIDMTIDVMKHFGVAIEHENYTAFRVKGRQNYHPSQYDIEGDWSGASCLLVAGATSGSEVTVENISPRSRQADRMLLTPLMESGAGVSLGWDSVTTRRSRLSGFTFDATDSPDLFPALVALAGECDGESQIVGTQRLVHKESNRAETLVSEFSKLGLRFDLSQSNIMRIERDSRPTSPVTIDSHDDHRIAMAAAVAALTSPQPVTITSAQCVAKSYPAFWDDLKQLGAKVE